MHLLSSPDPESSTQLNSECMLRPHIVPHFCEGTRQSILSVLYEKKGSVCHRGGRLLPKYTPAPAPHTATLCPGRAQTCQATRAGKKEAWSELRVQSVSLICQEGHCQGSAAYVVHYYWKGMPGGGAADDRAGSQLVTLTPSLREEHLSYRD